MTEFIWMLALRDVNPPFKFTANDYIVGIEIKKKRPLLKVDSGTPKGSTLVTLYLEKHH